MNNGNLAKWRCALVGTASRDMPERRLLTVSLLTKRRVRSSFPDKEYVRSGQCMRVSKAFPAIHFFCWVRLFIPFVPYEFSHLCDFASLNSPTSPRTDIISPLIFYTSPVVRVQTFRGVKFVFRNLMAHARANVEI